MSFISKLTTLSAAGASGDSYFFALLASNTGSVALNAEDREGLVVNSSGVIGSLSKLNLSSNQSALLWALNPDGSTKFRVEIDETTNNCDTEPFGLQTIGTDFYTTINAKTTSGVENCNLCKISDTGSLTWQVTEGGSSQGGRHNPKASATDGSQIVQVGSTRNNGAASNDFGFANSFNTSGSLNWRLVFEYNSQGWEARACTFDSSGNLYIGSFGYGIDGGNNVSGEAQNSITKYNSSGTNLSQYTYGDLYGETPYKMASDSNDNVYMLFRTQGNSVTAGTYITKVNSSLVPQWHRYAVYDSQNVIDLTVDGNDDILVVGRGGSPLRVIILKFLASTGALVFSRFFYHSSGNCIPKNIAVDANNDILVSGKATSFGYQTSGFVLKVRGDGTGTGTYGNFTYADASLSVGATASFTTSNNRYSNKSTSNIATGVGATMAVNAANNLISVITPTDLT